MMDPELTKALCDIYGKIDGVILELQKRSADSEIVLATEQVILPNQWNGISGSKGYWESQTIQNDGYCCGRLLIDVAFDIAATAGLSVNMYYKGSIIGEVIRVSSAVQVSGGGSLSLDLAKLSGFRFVVINHDPTHTLTVKELRLMMWGKK